MRVALLIGLSLVCANAQAAAPKKVTTTVETVTATTAEGIEKLVSAETRATAKSQALTGRFVQLKTLSDLPKPLRSSGQFFFARGRGVLWQVEQPFVAEYLLAGDQLTAREQGGASVTVGAAQQPGLAAASRLFAALFALDLSVLETDFVLTGTRAGDTWRIVLKPRHAALASALTEATLEGAAQLQQVRLVDGRGDVTTIELADLKPLAVLPPEVLARWP